MIDPTQLPQVALDFMNEDHADAAAITNRLFGLVEAEAPEVEAVSETFAQLLDHCRVHFAREEKQMQLAEFPAYPVHKNEHERVLAEISVELMAWRESSDLTRLQHYLENILLFWFVDHIKTMDTVTARYVVAQGGPFEVA